MRLFENPFLLNKKKQTSFPKTNVSKNQVLDKNVDVLAHFGILNAFKATTNQQLVEYKRCNISLG